MTVSIQSRLSFTCEAPAPVLLQFEVATIAAQEILESETQLRPEALCNRVPAQDGIGERIWINAAGRVDVEYRAKVALTRSQPPLDECVALQPYTLPGDAVPYLLDSRYCRADDFQSLVASEFEGTTGGARIAAIRNWISDHFDYVPGVSDASTDATDSFIARQGICRDYAHVLVTLARASSIPARYVACYAPGVTPQDFHAVAEVFLATPDEPKMGRWHLVDATGMADLANAAIIGIGRDAADVSFLTSFGPMTFHSSEVEVSLEA